MANDGNHIPEGWTTATIKNIFDIKYGKGLVKGNRNASGSINVYGSNGTVGKHNKAITKGPTIIIGRKGSVGEVNLSYENCWPIDTTYFIDCFHCDLPPRFWELYLKHLRLGQRDKSSAIPGLNRDDIYSIEIFLTPLNEQRRIVEKLEKLLERVESAKARLEKIPVLLKRFRQSVLSAACSGKLTKDWREKNPDVESASELVKKITEKKKEEKRPKRKNNFDHSDPDFSSEEMPERWVRCKLGLLSELITKGASPNWQGIKYKDDGILFITSENVGMGCLILDNKKYVEEKFNSLQKRSILKHGDLLTNIVGASIGRTAIFDLDATANINQAVALIRLYIEVDKRYILNTLNSPITIDFMHQEKVDVARANLSLEDVNNFPIFLPPLPEQREIVRRVEVLFAHAHKIEARYQKAKAFVDKLTPSLLSKAFRGELVPQDPNDEPASVLLERIREEREKQETKRRQGREKRKPTCSRV